MTENGIYLFYSYDLANSTAFKEEYPWLWKDVFTSYYDACINFHELQGALWKMTGDEVLGYERILNVEYIYERLEFAGTVLQEKRIIEFVKNICMEKHRKKGESEHRIEMIGEIIETKLAGKLTAWLAECNASTEGEGNIIYERQLANQQTFLDFFGPEIDEGFRISKHVIRNRILVSPLLAWVAWKGMLQNKQLQDKFEDSFRIVSYAKLKGVWEERKFPLVMFAPSFHELENQMEYDEIDDKLYAGAHGRTWEKFLADEHYHISRLDVILENVGQKRKAESIWKVLNQFS